MNRRITIVLEIQNKERAESIWKCHRKGEQLAGCTVASIAEGDIVQDGRVELDTELTWQKLHESEECVQILEKTNEELNRRIRTQSRNMVHTMKAADMATGYENKSGGFEESAMKARDSGSKGAVQRLIAQYSGLQKKYADAMEKLASNG